jgi:hypothetical protein
MHYKIIFIILIYQNFYVQNGHFYQKTKIGPLQKVYVRLIAKKKFCFIKKNSILGCKKRQKNHWKALNSNSKVFISTMHLYFN